MWFPVVRTVSTKGFYLSQSSVQHDFQQSQISSFLIPTMSCYALFSSLSNQWNLPQFCSEPYLPLIFLSFTSPSAMLGYCSDALSNVHKVGATPGLSAFKYLVSIIVASSRTVLAKCSWMVEGGLLLSTARYCSQLAQMLRLRWLQLHS